MLLKKRQIQNKLDAITRIANELDEEAKRRWGGDAMLFFDAGGKFIMTMGDASEGCRPDEFVWMKSRDHCSMSCGEW